jgi:NTP pyrophosphatase (non-canonical NTP hydrolase)
VGHDVIGALTPRTRKRREQLPSFVLAQAAKLAEEVGELQAEVLGHAGYQRASKDQCFTAESISGELTDVMICVALLASSHDIDLGKALSSTMKKIEVRHKGDA